MAVDVLETLKELYPNGDPLFLEMMFQEIELYNSKNKDYAAGQVGQKINPNGNFDRVACFFKMYPGLKVSDSRVVCLTYIMKQLDQISWSLSRGYEGEIEGLDSRLQDIAVYTNILRVLHKRMSYINYTGLEVVIPFNDER